LRRLSRWAQEISVPVLLQHGGADAIVHSSVVLDFARRLSEHGKPHDLAIYAGDDHPIANHVEERLTCAISWMQSLLPPRMVSVVADDFKLAVPERVGIYSSARWQAKSADGISITACNMRSRLAD
jgi:dienelactone hydrolase